jgi:hypothetical protein
MDVMRPIGSTLSRTPTVWRAGAHAGDRALCH